jgi:hypothetical protein
MAPTITPTMEPMPPRTTMQRMIADSRKVKLAGLTKVVLAAKIHRPFQPRWRPGQKRQFGPGFIDTHGLAGDFIFAQGEPGPADT